TLGGETIGLPHLVGKEYWLHAGMIAKPQTPAAPACRCTTFRFSRILNLNIQYDGGSRKISKKILEQVVACSRISSLL
ncbi:MAG TPA: hypothetical protein VFB65_06705, partial [Pyrinomonadaceae bacterium]|nr:hypothetical protein [Pyrinomonadaceae bacterium]